MGLLGGTKGDSPSDIAAQERRWREELLLELKAIHETLKKGTK